VPNAGSGAPCASSSASRRNAPRVVDRTAVVRIDERKSRRSLPWVDIRHAGRGQLAQRLGEGIQAAKTRNAAAGPP